MLYMHDTHYAAIHTHTSLGIGRSGPRWPGHGEVECLEDGADHGGLHPGPPLVFLLVRLLRVGGRVLCHHHQRSGVMTEISRHRVLPIHMVPTRTCPSWPSSTRSPDLPEGGPNHHPAS